MSSFFRPSTWHITRFTRVVEWFFFLAPMTDPWDDIHLVGLLWVNVVNMPYIDPMGNELLVDVFRWWVVR